MTIFRGPGGTGSATSDSDTTEFQEFLVQSQAARDAALAAQVAAELAETNAETAETNAETAETNAETAATNAASSASSAASSASSASSSASAASTSASNASSSASSASTSASAASSSASAASTSASNAATSATNAASSATAAASSATSASSSASTATTQATNAAASASAASTSASSASAAQTAAEAARDAALSAYDNFDDRYLGPKSSDPTLDNDGNALLTGALYFNTSSNVMKVYTGSSWVAAYVSAAGVLLTANNLSDVASTATSRTNLNVPTRTGGDASGTWGIDITGNAATATTATSATSATSATTATNVSGGTASVTSITDSGNLTFTGTGNRITGDFSNATISSRVAFQTSTTNGSTGVVAMPNGTSNTAGFLALPYSAIVGNASSYGQFSCSLSEVKLDSGILPGGGSYLPMTFYTGGSERMRVDTSGNVGIGTSSPAEKLEVAGMIRLSTNPSNPSTNDASIYNASGIGPTISGNAISFRTQLAERARIDSSGSLLVGFTAGGLNNSGSFQFTPGTSAYGGVVTVNHSTSNVSGSGYINFGYNGSAIGSIAQNGTTAVAYNTSSDYRLKNTIAPMTGALAKVQQLKPCTYRWKADGSAGEGFIAHELQEVCPQAVTGEKDAVDAEGKPVYQGIDTSFLVATLTAAIQEQQTIITAQAAQIQQLREKVLEVEEGTSNMLVENTNNLYETITALTARVAALESN